MKLHFAKDQWNTEDVTYAYSRRFQETPVFVQKEEWVESTENPAEDISLQPAIFPLRVFRLRDISWCLKFGRNTEIMNN